MVKLVLLYHLSVQEQKTVTRNEHQAVKQEYEFKQMGETGKNEETERKENGHAQKYIAW